jgi:hypothetical protein
MAQVTMSGEAGFAYVSDKTAGVTTSGMAQTDGSVTIAATDDLGGGMKLSAAHTVDLKGRSAVTAENSTMVLSGAFGSVLMGAINAGNGIIGKGAPGAVGRGLDGVVVDGDTPVDLIQYTSPELMTGLNVFVNTAEITVGAGNGSFQGTGMGVNYSAGPLAVTFDSTNYSGYAASVALATQLDSRQRLSFSYDMGVAKVGYGTQAKSYQGTGVDNNQTVMGVTAPVGAFTVSLARVTNDNGAAADQSDTDLGINYALSKRTALNFSSLKFKTDGAASDTKTRLRLKTTF